MQTPFVGSGMPHQVHDALLHAMSGTELSRVRTDTLTTANTHNHSATSSTTEPPAGVPSRPWQCSCAGASLGACTDVSSPAGYALLLGLPPPTRSATTNCLAC